MTDFELSPYLAHLPAELHGNFGAFAPEVLARPVKVGTQKTCLAASGWDSHPKIATWADLLVWAAKPKRSTRKDASAILQGEAEGGMRRSNKMRRNYILLLDNDVGLSMDEAAQLLLDRGWGGFLYSTWSHGAPSSTVKEQDVKDTYDTLDPSYELVQEILLNKNKYDPRVFEGYAGPRDVSRSTSGFTIRHNPMEKSRIGLILHEPWEFLIAGAAQKEQIEQWSRHYAGLCAELGQNFDAKTIDCARLMYGPVIRNDAGQMKAPRVMFVPGAPVDLTQIKPVETRQTAPSTRVAKGGGSKTSTKRRPQQQVASNDSVLRRAVSHIWSRENGHFEMAAFCAALGQEVRCGGDPDMDQKVTIACIREPHATPPASGVDMGSWATNSSTTGALAVWGCAHSGCADENSIDRVAALLDATGSHPNEFAKFATRCVVEFAPEKPDELKDVEPFADVAQAMAELRLLTPVDLGATLAYCRRVRVTKFFPQDGEAEAIQREQIAQAVKKLTGLPIKDARANVARWEPPVVDDAPIEIDLADFERGPFGLQRYYSNPNQALEDFDRAFSFVIRGKESWLLKTQPSEGKLVECVKLTSIEQVLESVKVEVGKGEDAEDIPVVKYWRHEHPKKVIYEGIGFAPPGAPPCPEAHLNLWSGFAFEPRPDGNWLLLDEHLSIIAKHNVGQSLDDPEPNEQARECRAYIDAFFADAIQLPGRAKLGQSLTLKGERGVGKSLPFVFYRAIIGGRHSIVVNDQESLLGRFNSHLTGRVFVHAEEAHWPGDRAGESKLKTLITENTLPSEEKFVDLVEVPSFTRLGISANPGWTVPFASKLERRFSIFEVPTHRNTQNAAYFKEMRDQMFHQGGLAAWMHYLQQFKPEEHWASGWDRLRQPFATEAVKVEIAHSLSAEERWITHIVARGGDEVRNDEGLTDTISLHSGSDDRIEIGNSEWYLTQTPKTLWMQSWDQYMSSIGKRHLIGKDRLMSDVMKRFGLHIGITLRWFAPMGNTVTWYTSCPLEVAEAQLVAARLVDAEDAREVPAGMPTDVGQWRETAQRARKNEVVPEPKPEPSAEVIDLAAFQRDAREAAFIGAELGIKADVRKLNDLMRREPEVRKHYQEWRRESLDRRWSGSS